jgi:hypothetical protein
MLIIYLYQKLLFFEEQLIKGFPHFTFIWLINFRHPTTVISYQDQIIIFIIKEDFIITINFTIIMINLKINLAIIMQPITNFSSMFLSLIIAWGNFNSFVISIALID